MKLLPWLVEEGGEGLVGFVKSSSAFGLLAFRLSETRPLVERTWQARPLLYRSHRLR